MEDEGVDVGLTVIIGKERTEGKDDKKDQEGEKGGRYFYVLDLVQ